LQGHPKGRAYPYLSIRTLGRDRRVTIGRHGSDRYVGHPSELPMVYIPLRIRNSAMWLARLGAT
jgi:hypothetical protein